MVVVAVAGGNLKACWAVKEWDLRWEINHRFVTGSFSL